jgi:putative ABC transport system permease protein
MDVPGVTSAEPLYISSVNWKNPQTRKKTPIMVIGMDVDRPPFDMPEVNQHLDQIKLPNTVLFDRASRGQYDKAIKAYEQGETITTEIRRHQITIGGLFKLGSSFGHDATLMTSDQNFFILFPQREPGTVSLGLVRLEPGANLNQVKKTLNQRFAGLEDVRVLTKEEFIDFEQAYWGTNRPVGVIFGFGTVIGFVVGVAIVYQVLSTDVNDHLGEYATFKAMGYRHSFLLGIVFEEAIILSVCGFLPGLGISVGLYNLMSFRTGLPITLTLLRAVGVFVVTVIMCMVSGAIATRRLQSADPADIF